MRSGELSLAIEIPPGFARDLQRGRRCRSAPGSTAPCPSAPKPCAATCRACTSTGWPTQARQGVAWRRPAGGGDALSLQPRRASLPAMVPAVIPLLLLMLPGHAHRAGRGAREGAGLDHQPLRHAGDAQPNSCWASSCPTSRWPCSTFLLMTAAGGHRVRRAGQGQLCHAGAGGAALRLIATGMGLLASTFTAARLRPCSAMIGTMLPAIQFSGLINPVSSLEGVGALDGRDLPGHAFHVHHQPGRVQQGAGPADLQAAAFWPLLLIARRSSSALHLAAAQAGALTENMEPPASTCQHLAPGHQGAVEPVARPGDAGAHRLHLHVSVYTAATAMPETLHHAAIAIVDEDHSPCRSASSAFLPAALHAAAT
jgi:ribosome-dependent ATPase